MDDPDTLAIDILTWIASDNELFNRFIGLNGIEPSQIRQSAQEPGFMAGVISFLMGHEPTLFKYCEQQQIDPQTVKNAYDYLTKSSGYEI